MPKRSSSQTLLGGKLIKRLPVQAAGLPRSPSPRLRDIPFLRQADAARAETGRADRPLRHRGRPGRTGPTGALHKVLTEMTPQQVIEEVKGSKLRGRGGAGFPTGRQVGILCQPARPSLRHLQRRRGRPRRLHGRLRLEGDPHAVLEGMAIAAYAMGSDRGLHVRAQEYPLAVQTLTAAIRQAEDLGLLGDNILGTGLQLQGHPSPPGPAPSSAASRRALMSSLEGKVGRPRPKYIRSTEKGFRDSPSNLNNVETYANVPEIILRGGAVVQPATEPSAPPAPRSSRSPATCTTWAWWKCPWAPRSGRSSSASAAASPTRSSSRRCRPAAPPAGCIPIPGKFIDINVGFGKLAEIGSMMGSGGMIVMDENTCMVEIVALLHQLPGRGVLRPVHPLPRGADPHEGDPHAGSPRARGARAISSCWRRSGPSRTSFSLCGLGTSAANPVLSTIRYFREEYEAHIRDKKCPAGVCKPLLHYEIDPEKCTGCGLCRQRCPAKAIEGEKKKPHTIHQELCIKCMECYQELQIREHQDHVTRRRGRA